jgi:hypothetical protein
MVSYTRPRTNRLAKLVSCEPSDDTTTVPLNTSPPLVVAFTELSFLCLICAALVSSGLEKDSTRSRR